MRVCDTGVCMMAFFSLPTFLSRRVYVLEPDVRRLVTAVHVDLKSSLEKVYMAGMPLSALHQQTDEHRKPQVNTTT